MQEEALEIIEAYTKDDRTFQAEGSFTFAYGLNKKSRYSLSKEEVMRIVGSPDNEVLNLEKNVFTSGGMWVGSVLVQIYGNGHLLIEL